jgi:hypothetical protein
MPCQVPRAPTLYDWDLSTGTEEAGFDVSGGIAFSVPIVGIIKRDQLVDRHNDIPGNIRVGVFVDCYSSSGMGRYMVQSPSEIPLLDTTF